MDHQQIDFLHLVREYELQHTVALYRKYFSGSILEIGSGTGFQLKLLKKLGTYVCGVDLKTGNYHNYQIEDVTMYDGKVIPFPDKSFNLVFSSNVLEHVKELDNLNDEIRRVLKEDGICIHILPSASWRLVTIVCYVIYIIKRIYAQFFSRSTQEESVNDYKREAQLLTSNILRYLKRIIFARHGERGHAFTELYYFSQYWWKKTFLKSEWKISDIVNIKLIYSGYQIFGKKLSIATRVKLSRYLGGSCNIFVLKK